MEIRRPKSEVSTRTAAYPIKLEMSTAIQARFAFDLGKARGQAETVG